MAKTISYKKLWKLLIDKNMSKSELKTESGQLQNSAKARI